MIVIKPSEENQEITIIPRVKDIRVCDVLLINELSEEEITFNDVVLTYINGFISFTLNHKFSINDSYYSIDLKDGLEYIYRGKIWVIDTDNLQNFEEKEMIYV